MTRFVRKYLRNSGLSAALLQHAPIAQMTFEQRRRSRQKVTLNNEETINVVIDRGQVLVPGDVLVADDGGLIVVQAQHESLVRVTADTSKNLARAAYHLGNRHVTVEVGDGFLHLQYDPVLVEMLDRLGVHTSSVSQAFNPEHGAYGGGHKHGHDETFDEDYALAQAAYKAHEYAHSGRDQKHTHPQEHAHDREHTPSYNHDHTRLHEHTHAHSHSDNHKHDHQHNYGNEHNRVRSYGHNHKHDHDHDHERLQNNVSDDQHQHNATANAAKQPAEHNHRNHSHDHGRDHHSCHCPDE